MLLVSTQGFANQKPSTFRTWEYLDFTVLLSPNWAYTVLPGHTYEWTRDNDPSTDPKKREAKGPVLYELFTGPVYITKIGDVTVKLPLWYYYMGFPIKATTTTESMYKYSHNIEFVPIVEYKMGDWKFWNRVIFHNTVYSNYYKEDSDRKGYSLLIREFFKVEYSLTPDFRLVVGDEIFVGIIEDSDTNTDALTPGLISPGFSRKGFSQNRFYLGCGYSFSPVLSITPLYILQTQHFKRYSNKVTEYDHYIQVTLSYALKLY